ncbi:DNA-directed RNA polymerases I, II, and III subunit RPABC3 [Savitreella phatthalungensis]
MSADQVLFEEQISVSSVDSSRYERVARIVGGTTSGDCTVTLDVNTELYPIAVGETVSVSVVSKLSDGIRDGSDYVMFGRVYKFDEGRQASSSDNSAAKANVYVSFGGLLLRIEADYRKLARLANGDVYLCMRK